MAELHLVLSEGEQEVLVRLLTAELKQKRVEVHRTEFSRDFRQHVEADVTRIEHLLEKLSAVAAPR